MSKKQVDLTKFTEPSYDFVQEGTIDYKIKWLNGKATISVGDIDETGRAVILSCIYEDFIGLENALKNNPKGVLKKFNISDKIGVIKARHIIHKFLNNFLSLIYGKLMEQKENGNEEKIIVPSERIKEKQTDKAKEYAKWNKEANG